MSTIIMTACWPLQMPSSQKSVLISLADNANDEGVCWPSVERIVERTCLTDRTVQKCLKWLEERAVISRQKRHKRSAVYTVTPENYQAWRRDDALPEDSSPENPSGEGPSGEESSPEKSSPEKNASRPENGGALDRKNVQFRPEAASPRTIKESKEEPTRNHQGGASAPEVSETPGQKSTSKGEGGSKPGDTLGVKDLVAVGVDRQHAQDWLKVRKDKKTPLTRTAWDLVVQEAEKAGLSVAEAVRISAENSWAGFRASWMDKAKAEANGGGGAAAPDALDWLRSWPGIVAKGNVLGLRQEAGEQPPDFKKRVLQAANLTDEQKARARADFGVHV
ncbi:helix-turn-helix domain-containing protein [Achromobacter insuavis]|uniref:helix-turn-helix domain-containing protein n=2 Tax=Pseudomonadati TaxID=3379134 RepID=UPI0029D7BEA7|nr:helix-turn-helix domain-containing protein [Achromobacter sp.]MCG2601525.1 helix-turn-helix domain-containing protein [Achromobacter sp.]